MAGPLRGEMVAQVPRAHRRRSARPRLRDPSAGALRHAARRSPPPVGMRQADCRGTVRTVVSRARRRGTRTGQPPQGGVRHPQGTRPDRHHRPADQYVGRFPKLAAAIDTGRKPQRDRQRRPPDQDDDTVQRIAAKPTDAQQRRVRRRRKSRPPRATPPPTRSPPREPVVQPTPTRQFRVGRRCPTAPDARRSHRLRPRLRHPFFRRRPGAASRSFASDTSRSDGSRRHRYRPFRRVRHRLPRLRRRRLRLTQFPPRLRRRLFRRVRCSLLHLRRPRLTWFVPRLRHRQFRRVRHSRPRRRHGRPRLTQLLPRLRRQFFRHVRRRLPRLRQRRLRLTQFPLRLRCWRFHHGRRRLLQLRHRSPRLTSLRPRLRHRQFRHVRRRLPRLHHPPLTPFLLRLQSRLCRRIRYRHPRLLHRRPPLTPFLLRLQRRLCCRIRYRHPRLRRRHPPLTPFPAALSKAGCAAASGIAIRGSATGTRRSHRSRGASDAANLATAGHRLPRLRHPPHVHSSRRATGTGTPPQPGTASAQPAAAADAPPAPTPASARQGPDPLRCTAGGASFRPSGRAHQAAAASPVPADTHGELGHYKIVRSLGNTDMGTVYPAVDKKLNRQVAPKVPRAAATIPDRPPRSSRASSRRRGPPPTCIIPASVPSTMSAASTTSTSSRWNTSRGLLLSNTRGRRQMAAGRRGGLRSFERSPMALAYSHDRGVVHRDIKSANIMIRPDGEPVVMDFGLALTQRRGRTSLTQDGGGSRDDDLHASRATGRQSATESEITPMSTASAAFFPSL